MEVRSTRRLRESSPDRAKACIKSRSVKPIKKVQVVYYLSRNGLLEHPHYIEVAHFANQPLRLKDVMDRLTVLRGNGMPSLYSWSCKRSYKSGYVWNDLSENDAIYPTEGAEYVLKGSELVEGCAEKFRQVNVSTRHNVQELNQLQAKIKTMAAPSPNRETEDHEYEEYEEEEAEEEFEYEDGEKTSYTTSTTPHSRCSRGVSTDELEEHDTSSVTQKTTNESARTDSSPVPTNTSPVPTNTSPSISNKEEHQSKSTSKRFEDSDRVVAESGSSRNSVLLQFIACGSSAVAKAKNTMNLKESVRKSESLRKGVVCKRAAVRVNGEEDMINYMSENPRFGNLQSEEKEYFSGSIVESMSEDRVAAEPVLKKSNSYNEERSMKAGMGEEMVKELEEKMEEVAVKAKCIPRKKSSSSKLAKKL